MKFLSLLLTLLLASSISLASASKASKREYMSGAAPSKTSADDIQDNLSRNDYVNLGGALSMTTMKAEATFISRPLIEAQETENGKKNMNGDDEIKKNIKTWMGDLVEKKMCFLIEIKSNDDAIETAQFTNWKAKLEQPTAKYIEVVFRNVRGVDSVPHAGSGLGETWVNNSYACTNSAVDLSKPFSLHLIPQWGGNSKRITLEWK